MNANARIRNEDALNKLKDKGACRMAFVQERALHDEVSQINAAKREGWKSGYK